MDEVRGREGDRLQGGGGVSNGWVNTDARHVHVHLSTRKCVFVCGCLPTRALCPPPRQRPLPHLPPLSLSLLFSLPPGQPRQSAARSGVRRWRRDADGVLTGGSTREATKTKRRGNRICRTPAEDV